MPSPRRVAPLRAALSALIFVTGAAAPAAGQAVREPEGASPFGFWIVPPREWGKPVVHFERPVTFTTASVDAQNALATLTAARASGMRLVVRIGAPGRRAMPRFSVDQWKTAFDPYCSLAIGRTTDCVDIEPFIDDGTIVAARLLETNGEVDNDPTHPTMDQLRDATREMKRLWPRLKTAVDGSNPCALVPSGGRWSAADLDLFIINVFTGSPRDLAQVERRIDRGVECAERLGAGYILDINPFGLARRNGFGPQGVRTFEHAVKYALMLPESQGTIVWRWWPATGESVSNGNKTFPNVWNEAINPGIGAGLRRIERCAANRTSASCGPDSTP